MSKSNNSYKSDLKSLKKELNDLIEDRKVLLKSVDGQPMYFVGTQLRYLELTKAIKEVKQEIKLLESADVKKD